jgi:Tol biopolymer transport system component
MQCHRVSMPLLSGTFCALISAAPAHAQKPQRIYAETPLSWFEESAATARVSSDGKWAIYGARGSYRLIDLTTGREDSLRMRGGLEEVSNATFGPGGKLVRLGHHGPQRAWFLGEGASAHSIGVPADAVPLWSDNGRSMAYVSAGVPDKIVIRTDSVERVHAFDDAVTGFTWGRSGALYVVKREESGLSSIIRLDPATDARRVLRTGLDASPSVSPIAVSADEHTLYIGLAAVRAGGPEARHNPDLNRTVHVYALDLRSGEQYRVDGGVTGEAIAPVIAGNSLYWVRTNFHTSAVVLPATGGAPVTAASDAMLPMWRPDGKQIAFTYGMNHGGWRVTDSPLNMDAAVVSVARNGKPIAKQKAIVTGYHEDFTPAWSPQGNWIAYHSHRPLAPVFLYADKRSRDEMYIRRPWLPTNKEIKLSDYGWEVGWADWSPDGTKVMFSSWVRGKPPGTTVLWAVTIDTTTGQPLRHDKVDVPAEINNIRTAAWSPAGDEIAIETGAPGKPHALWIVKPDGTGAQKIVEFPFVSYSGVDWSPDGKLLAYSAIVDGRMQLFTVPRAGGAPTQLTHGTAHMLQPQFSPDGKHIAATRMLQTKEIWRMPLAAKPASN